VLQRIHSISSSLIRELYQFSDSILGPTTATSYLSWDADLETRQPETLAAATQSSLQ